MLLTIIILISIAIFFILFLVFRYLRKDAASYGPDIQNTSFIAYINPFDTTIRKIYRSLSPENKGAFWSVVSNTSVAILTFWVGLTVQYLILDLTKSEESKLSHFQVVDKLKPMYDNMLDSCTQHVFNRLYDCLPSNNGDKSLDITKDITQDDIIQMFNSGDFSRLGDQGHLTQFYLDEKEWDNIVYAGKKCFETSGSIAPYLEIQKGNKLLTNNSYIFVGNYIYEALKDSIQRDSVSFVNDCFNKMASGSITGKISTADKSLCSLCYMYYKNLQSYKTDRREGLNNINFKFSMCLFLSNLYINPLLKNTIIMREEFSSKDRDNIFLISAGILFICLLVGYLIFRIVIIRFFNRQNLPSEISELKSKNEQLNKEINDKKKDLYELNLQLKEKIKDLEQVNINNSLLISTNGLLQKANESLNTELEKLRASLSSD